MRKDFWSYVTKSEACWAWTGRRDKDGYGKCRVGQGRYREVRAHRYVSWSVGYNGGLSWPETH